MSILFKFFGLGKINSKYPGTHQKYLGKFIFIISLNDKTVFKDRWPKTRNIPIKCPSSNVGIVVDVYVNFKILALLSGAVSSATVFHYNFSQVLVLYLIGELVLPIRLH